MGNKQKEYPEGFLKALKELEDEGVIEIDEKGMVKTLTNMKVEEEDA